MSSFVEAIARNLLQLARKHNSKLVVIINRQYFFVATKNILKPVAGVTSKLSKQELDEIVRLLRTSGLDVEVRGDE